MKQKAEFPPDVPPEKAEEIRRESAAHRARAKELFGGLETAGKELAEKAEGAIRDKLTGLLNRRGTEEELMKSASRLPHSRREGLIEHFTVVLLDIDNFKKINDTYGHQVGDKVLQEVAAYLRDVTREGDTMGRWGGEEFVMGVEGLDISEVLKKKFNLGKGRSGKAHIMVPVDIESPDGEKIRIGVTLSGGVTEFLGGEDLKTAMERADQALYGAKHSGRNVILPWDETMAKLAQEKRARNGTKNGG